MSTIDDGAEVAAVAEPPTAARPSSERPPPAEGVVGRLDDACLRAVTAAEQVYAALEDAGSAIAALDARRLDEVLHEVRPLRDQLRAGTAACDVDVRRPDRAIGTGVPASPPAGP
ncbi:hypothetical protein [Blastococcus aggregatus]|uniref:hypothetical protein n=1 Tax=Blastococcus aggregatus TaxID=38502 RepID=UPI001141D6B6|nr:hypothetical protein [Blastococcus aggregatus]